MIKSIVKFFCFVLFFLNCSDSEEADDTIFTPEDNTGELSGIELEIIGKINSYRIYNGKTPLKSDGFLYKLADSRNIANTKIDSVSHKGIGIIIERAGEYELTIAENLGYGYTSAETVFNAWKKSDDHRNYMLRDDWTYTGLAALRNEEEDGMMYYCQVFAKRRT